MPKMNVSSILTKDYENICPCGAAKNKPKTNPISRKPKNECKIIVGKGLRESAPPEPSGKQTQSNPTGPDVEAVYVDDSALAQVQ